MRLYAQSPVLRSRPLAADLGLLAWLALWILIARAVHGALLALATAPLPRLAALPDGTGAGWRAGDAAAVRTLAALELDRLGLRLPVESARVT
jgi:hypothetical protein